MRHSINAKGNMMAILVPDGFSKKWPPRTFASMLRGAQANASQHIRARITAQSASLAFAGMDEPVARPVEQKVAEPKPVAVNPQLPTAVRLKSVDIQHRLQARVAKVNLTMPAGCHLSAWHILPLQLFEGELGRFLTLACDFYGYGAENIMLLPVMESGSKELNLPRHPHGTLESHLDNARRRLRLLQRKVAEQHTRTAQALQNGDLSHMFRSSDRQQQCRTQLAMQTTEIATDVFGKSAWTTHEQCFRSVIKSL